MKLIQLTSKPLVRRLLRARSPQLALQLVSLAGLALVIVAGLLGTPVGSRNPATVLVWIVWWAVLMIVAVPFFGRAWCSICPLPLPGEWLQRGALLAPRRPARGLQLRWPRRLRGLWLQNGAFVLVALFSLPVLTQPRWTALLLAGLVALAVAGSLVFERRAFCRYLCPVGGFIGLYSQAAPLELRVIDTRVCADHAEKTCYGGNQAGYGCPWMVFPAALKTNVSCGLCLECLRTCPLDNVSLQLRLPSTSAPPAHAPPLDEAFKAVILLGSAVVYAFVLQGPFDGLRLAAASVGSAAWLGYVAGFLAVTVVTIPGALLLAGRGPAGASGGDGLREFAPALIPLGLGTWAAFSLGFVISNLGLIPAAAFDPLGLGWQAAAGANASPGGPWVAVLQAALVLTGLTISSRQMGTIAERRGTGGRSAIPLRGVCLILAAIPLWVFTA